MSEELEREIEAVIDEDDPEELVGAIIEIAMAAENAAWAQQSLLRLAGHPDATVRGNAVIAFAHLADRFGALDREQVDPVLRAALNDPKEYVREQAEAALDALAVSLGW